MPQAKPEVQELGKRVSWVELYLDLVFVLAVGQLAHLIIEQPRLHTVSVALGLFVALWWTWIGFTVLYNRHGADDTFQRTLFLAASVPVGAAAVAVRGASQGHVAAFAISLAFTRIVLAAGNARDDDPSSSRGDALRLWTARACLISAALFLISIIVPRPFSYLLWAAAYLHESAVMFAGDGLLGRRLNRRRRRGGQASAEDAGATLETHHFAERFGLFIIILLGEVVVEAGEAAADWRSPSAATWFGLVAAMVLAGALWWTYFTAAADIDLNALRVSRGSPAAGRAIFAVGHMVPAFALLIAAAGIGLLIRASPPTIAFWLASVGVGMYLAGTSALPRDSSIYRRASRAAVLSISYAFGVLRLALSPPEFLWLLALWAGIGVRAIADGRTPVDDTGSSTGTSNLEGESL